MGPNTSAYCSCAATLNGELFVFGGDGSSNEKQVIFINQKRSLQTYHLRSVKLLIVHWNVLVNSQMHLGLEHVERFYLMATNELCFVSPKVAETNASGNNNIVQIKGLNWAAEYCWS